MEWLRRVELIIDEYTNLEIFPVKEVIKLIPHILLVSEEEHRINIVIDFEVAMISKSGEEHGFVSTYRWLPLFILFLVFIADE